MACPFIRQSSSRISHWHFPPSFPELHMSKNETAVFLWFNSEREEDENQDGSKTFNATLF
jgi:hypothetical protein